MNKPHHRSANDLKAELASAVHQAIRKLEPPKNLFLGLSWNSGLAPDNIVFFKRTDTAELRPKGVTNNYHHRFELVVVLRKSGPVHIGEKSYILEPCEAALIFPNQFHHFMDVEPGEMEWLFITFELNNSEKIAPLKDSPRTLGAEEMNLLKEIMQEYVGSVPESPDSIRIVFKLSQLLCSMLGNPVIPEDRRDIHASEKSRDVLLEKINQYIRSHLDAPITLGAMAETLGYSESHLRLVFRTELGMSLGKYIRESRLSYAAMLLHSTHSNVSEVAQKCGFESLFAFSRAFKRAYGMPPKPYSKLLAGAGISELRK